MSNEELRAQARTSSPQIKVAAGIWVTGMMIIAAVTIIWVVLAFLAGDYYSNSKVVRDAAEAGSGVLSQLSNIRLPSVKYIASRERMSLSLGSHGRYRLTSGKAMTMENQKARRVFNRSSWVPARGPLVARPAKSQILPFCSSTKFWSSFR